MVYRYRVNCKRHHLTEANLVSLPDNHYVYVFYISILAATPRDKD